MSSGAARRSLVSEHRVIDTWGMPGRAEDGSGLQRGLREADHNSLEADVEAAARAERALAASPTDR